MCVTINIKSTPGTKGMDIQELNVYYNKFKYGEEIFHTLMQKRVREICWKQSL